MPVSYSSRLSAHGNDQPTIADVCRQSECLDEKCLALDGVFFVKAYARLALQSRNLFRVETLMPLS